MYMMTSHLLDIVKFLQGIIYSETAAANYGDSPVFEISTEFMPACRLGTPEEVMIMDTDYLQICVWKGLCIVYLSPGCLVTDILGTECNKYRYV